MAAQAELAGTNEEYPGISDSSEPGADIVPLSKEGPNISIMKQ
jgi:hypothetical protein